MDYRIIVLNTEKFNCDFLYQIRRDLVVDKLNEDFCSFVTSDQGADTSLRCVFDALASVAFIILKSQSCNFDLMVTETYGFWFPSGVDLDKMIELIENVIVETI